MVTMASGKSKPIEEVAVDDLVVGLIIPDLPPEDEEKTYLKWSALSLQGSSFFPAQVYKVHRGEEPYYYLINKTTKATFEHPFLVKTDEGEWKFVRAENLIVGYIAMTLSGEIPIQSIVRVDERIQTANLGVSAVNTFLADEFLVHNNTTRTFTDTKTIDTSIGNPMHFPGGGFEGLGETGSL